MSRHHGQLDEYDLERAHELERRLDRDMEREPFLGRARTRRRRPRYFSGLMFRPITITAQPDAIASDSASIPLAS